MKVEMIGKRFGRLTVIEEAGRVSGGQITWICRCDCGNMTKPISGSRMRLGRTRSCGCLSKELLRNRTSTHKATKTRLYNVWLGMRKRCYYPKHNCYADYGGRGISVCAEWKDDFAEFQAWALANGYKEAPKGECTLDRIDNSKGYSPENCRWTSMVIQDNNKRNNKMLVIDGRTQTVAQWAHEYGLNPHTVYSRLRKGRSAEDAIKTPLRKARRLLKEGAKHGD